MAKPERVENESDAIEVITEAGYSNLSNLTHHGATWHCDATNSSGAPVKVVISGNGEVHEKGPDEDDGDSAEEPVAEPKE